MLLDTDMLLGEQRIEERDDAVRVTADGDGLIELALGALRAGDGVQLGHESV